MSCKIIDIEPLSIADNLGIEIGSELLSINGKIMKDFIDYRYLVMDSALTIEVKTMNNENKVYNIEKDFDEDLGLIFESAVFDGIKKCANKCIFCFVDQQPEGLRESLYIKDDDYRLSFLQGAYVTLTNLTKKDRERIASLHLGPLYVSVHTTNPELRVKMLRNKNAANLFKELDFLKDNDIPIHAQIVLCPDYNDGKELIRTLDDLWKYKKILLSIAIVPLGLTKYRKDKLTPVNKEKAIETINIVDDFNKKIKRNIASVSDEFFLIAKMDVPLKSYYNGYSQLDDGVGAIRCITDDFNKRIKKVTKSILKKKEFSICCSYSAKDVFFMFAKELNKIENLTVSIHPIKNDFWGDEINVAGLITASDLINQLKGKCFKNILIPSIMLRPYTKEFLDGLNITDVEKALNAKIHVVQDIYSTKEIFDFIKS